MKNIQWPLLVESFYPEGRIIKSLKRTAIVWSLQVFYRYVWPKVYNEDRSPPWLEKMNNVNQRLTRWALAVQPYCYEIYHCCETLNKNADGLSRGGDFSNGQMVVTTEQPQPSP